MSTEEHERDLLDAAGELRDAAGDFIESGRARDVATGLIEDVTAALQGGVETATETVRNLDREDITPEKIQEAFQENAFDGVVALAGGAGVTLASAAVRAVYENADGDPFTAIYTQLFNPDAAAPEAEADPNASAETPQAQAGFMDLIMAGNIGGAFDLIKSKFTIFETLGGLLQSFVPNVNIGGMIESVKGMLGIAEERLTTQFADVSDPQAQQETPTPSAVVAADETVTDPRPGEGALRDRGELSAEQRTAAAIAEANGVREPEVTPAPDVESVPS